MEYPKKIQQAIESFARIPGVGAKTATRYVLFLSQFDHKTLEHFAQAVHDLGDISYCNRCGLYAESDLCSICASERSSSHMMCIVESISDCMAIEKSGQYRGVYHILGGVLNPLLGVGPDELSIDHLMKRIADEEIREIILAINPSVEGDATCSYIRQLVGSTIAVERIGFGIPMGGSLEYLDAMTIGKAIENRKKM